MLLVGRSKAPPAKNSNLEPKLLRPMLGCYGAPPLRLFATPARYLRAFAASFFAEPERE
jgi:hypothetical protein